MSEAEKKTTTPKDESTPRAPKEKSWVSDLYIPSNPREVRPPITLPRVGIWLLIIVIGGLLVTLFNNTNKQLVIDREDTVTEGETQVPKALTEAFDTDFSKMSIDSSLLLSGGPGKDGIPALFDPEFESLEETKIANTTRGILVEKNGQKKFYPYSILVWHEIVNDTVGGEAMAITFCPLCGSAIVYNRKINDEVHDFKVSGLLYESNMIMYDTKTESLFSQSLGQGVAGEYNQVQLQLERFQLLELFEVKKNHPDARIMTTDTGHSRDYTFYPYGNYDNQEGLYFPVQHQDNRFDAKEIFYIIPINDQSVAVRIGELKSEDKLNSKEFGFLLTKNGSEIDVTDTNGNFVPGYFEMWFSWATQHPDSGNVIDPGN